MAFRFGCGTLFLQRNLVTTNIVASTGTAGTGVAITSGSFMLDGVTGVLSAATSTITIAGSTGSGHLLYAFISGGSTVTGTLAHALFGSPIITAVNIPTAIVPIATFSFGTGASVVSTIVAWSGGSATKTIGKVQSFQYSLAYENAQMRGGGDIFPVDTQHFNGSVEGSFTFADQTSSHGLFFGGDYLSAGNSSGTWTLSALHRPEAVCIAFQETTNGITNTVTIHRAYITQGQNEFSRAGYLEPTFNFVAQANSQGNVMKVEA